MALCRMDLHPAVIRGTAQRPCNELSHGHEEQHPSLQFNAEPPLYHRIDEQTQYRVHNRQADDPVYEIREKPFLVHKLQTGI